MPVLLGPKSELVERALTDAIEHAPNVWAHARTMRWWQRMSAIDQDSARQMLATFPGGGQRWIASWDLASAKTINDNNPEVFNDNTGRTMVKFLKTDAGRRFATPPGTKARL